MEVLYVVGSCLTKNTSANMSHNSFIKGLLDNGCNVDIIMANDSWGEEDNALPIWDECKYYTFNSISKREKFRRFVHEKFLDKKNNNVISNEIVNTSDKIEENKELNNRPNGLREKLKKVFYLIFPTDPVYPLHSDWLKNAKKFNSEKQYDLVLSNSSPAASHRLVYELKKGKKIKYDRWIQVWEDPWYYDLYGGKSDSIKEEEHFLLQQASEIFYVSPLTLEYQKDFFPDCKEKMDWVPLPFFEFEKKEKNKKVDTLSFGYFGDYYSHTRNLVPFYNVLNKLNYKGYIFGDSDLNFIPNKNMIISGRVTLDKLEEIQDNTGVLVHLCNLKGGQIPGKIYHYSATDKPVLFILDGTTEEKEIIYNYFKKFDRYYFCDNEEDSIEKVINKISCDFGIKSFHKIEEFNPKNVVSKLLTR